MPVSIILVSAVGLSFVVAWVTVQLLRRLAPRWGMVAKPRADRWHRRPTPLLGGAGVFAGCFAGWAAFRPQVAGAPAIIAAATAVFLAGLADDIWTLKPYTKLSLQILAALMVVFAGLVLPWTSLPLVNDFVTVFWITGVTNAVNLLDNMDGLAAGITLVACVFQILFFLQNNQPGAALMVAILTGAVAAFFYFNFAPAAIFMGDCGSLFMGFMLASLALTSNWQRSRGLLAILMAPVLILLVPILDTSLVTLSRLRHGRAISQGGRDHSSHRLVALGLSERRAVLVLMGLAMLGGGGALLLRYLENQVLFFVIPCFALAVVFFAIRLGMVRVYADAPPATAVFSFLMEFSYRRRILEVLLDLTLMALAYLGAFLLRFGGVLPPDQIQMFDRFIPFVLGAETLVFLVGGMYSNLWHHICIEDVPIIFRCAAGGALVSAIVVLAMQFHPRLSLSVLILNGLLLLLLAGASRAALRLFSLWLQRQGASHDTREAALIYGAGGSGGLLADALRRDGELIPVGFLDDDARKVGRRHRGLPIFDPKDWERLVHEHAVRCVLISSTSISKDRVNFPGLRVEHIVSRWSVTAVMAKSALHGSGLPQ